MTEFAFIFQYGFTFFGIIVLLAALKGFLFPLYEKANFIPIQSEVIEVKKVKRQGFTIYMPAVKYEFSGTEYTFDELGSSSIAPSIGDSMEIFVNKNKPREAVSSIKFAGATPIILLIMGGLFTAGGISSFYFI